MKKILIDTNVLVYAYDRSEPEKQHRALKVLDHLAHTGNGVLAMQVLVEFCAVALHKLTEVLTPEQVEERVERYAKIFPLLPTTLPVVQEGLRGLRMYSLSFWDAQIWAVARMYGIPIILSEDFNPGATIEEVHFENPFIMDFDVTTLGV